MTVTLVHRGEDLLPQSSSEFNKKSAKKELSSKKVNVLTNTSVSGLSFGDSSLTVHLSTKTLPDVDLILYTVANSGATSLPPKSVYGDLVNTDINAIETDVALRAKNFAAGKVYRNVFAIGDAATVEGFEGKGTAQVAMAMAETAAYNVLAAVRGEKSVKFRYLNLGEMLTLGSDKATISGFDDRVRIEGGLASVLRRAVYSVRQPTTGQRIRSGGRAVGSGLGKIKEMKGEKSGTE